MRNRRPPLKMVGGVFSQSLGATGNPAAEDTENDARDSENNKDEQNRFRFIKINELTHPSNHRCKKLTDQRKQRCKNRRSSLKSSSFHKNIYGTCHERNRRTNIEKTPAKIIKKPISGTVKMPKQNCKGKNSIRSCAPKSRF